MDMMTGHMLAMASDAVGNCGRVFNWDMAAMIIVERAVTDARAGLQGDHSDTSGTILRDGEIVDDSYMFLGSMHAAPELVIDGEHIECWVADDGKRPWGCKTVWPQSARDIIQKGKQ